MGLRLICISDPLTSSRRFAAPRRITRRSLR
jgi:hypothetical protein